MAGFRRDEGRELAVLLLLPLLALGVAMLANSGRSRPSTALTAAGFAAFPPYPTSTPPPATPAPAATPSPLRVLAQLLEAGIAPPPQVILCAIAEAELAGRIDVAREIVEALIVPVVADAIRRGQIPGGQIPAQMPGPTGYGGSIPAWPSPEEPPSPPATYPPDRYYGIPTQAPQPGSVPHPGAEPPMPETPAPQPAVRDHRGAHRGTITVSGRSCPIEGVRGSDWEAFAARVARELPTFSSRRHVGAFRQSTARLAELGIDPAQIASSPDEQVRAFCADMEDAYRHARDSGMVAEFQGTLVDVPTPEGGTSIPIEVTLSGVLGVIQAAGLEGAASWLTEPSDRRKFANTTRAFVRTNGVF